MNNIQFIDLGLPSGTLWADRNLGADAPEETGDYYRFRETVAFTENSPEYAYDKIEGDIAGTDRDAATVNLGGNWRMPTKEEFDELIEQTEQKWTKQNGVEGMKVTGPNGNSIFLPASGWRYGDDGAIKGVGSCGNCWSASADSSYDGLNLFFYSGGWEWDYYFRPYGCTVRAVANIPVSE